MATGGRAQAVLRVGIAKSGKLAMERRVQPDRTITVGPEPTNTLVFGGASESITVFVKGPHGVSLSPDVRSRTTVRRGDPEATLTLGDRGRIDIDGLTVLYQLVQAAPVPVRSNLGPLDFRPRWLDDDDPIFVQSLATWSALGLLLGIYVATAPTPVNTGLANMDDYLVTLPSPVFVQPEPEPEVQVAVAEVERVQRDITPVEPPPTPPPRSDAQRAHDIAASRNRIEERMKKSGLLGSRGDSTWAIDVDDAVAFDSLSEARRWEGDEDGLRSRDPDARPGPGPEIELDGLGGGTSGVGNGPAIVVTQPPVWGQGDSPDDPAPVHKSLKQYASQVRYCYERELKRNPTLSGRLELGGDLRDGRFTQVWTESETVESLALEECVHQRVRNWNLPDDASGDVFWSYVFTPKE